MKDIVESFLELSERDQVQVLLESVNLERLDYITLIRFQRSNNYNTRDLAKELALNIPKEKLDYKTLLEFQKSFYSEERDLARELALKKFPKKLDYETLMELQGSGNFHVENLIRKLIQKIPPEEKLNKISKESKEFMSKFLTWYFVASEASHIFFLLIY